MENKDKKHYVGLYLNKDLYNILVAASKAISNFEGRKVSLSEIIRQAIVDKWENKPRNKVVADALDEFNRNRTTINKQSNKV